MKRIYLSFIFISFCILGFSQIDKDQLSLDVSKAEATNLESLKELIWKRYTNVTVEGQQKASAIFELSFEDDSLHVTQIDGQSSVKAKRGIRGRVQQNAIEQNMDYVGNALQLAVAYTYMSKGQLLDFFDKATLVEKDEIITASASNVYVKGDSLTISIESKSHLFISKSFSSLLNNDPISGKINYEKFNSGVNHVSNTVLNLPAKKALINAVNKDYTKRIE